MRYLLDDAGIADRERRAVDGGPAGAPGKTILVADPTDVGARIREYVDGTLQFPNHLEPVLEVVSHIDRVGSLCPIKPYLPHFPVPN